MNITVDYTIVIDADAQAVWALIADFEDMHWHPQVRSSRLVAGTAGQVGAVRELKLTDDSSIQESLAEVDHSAMVLVYSFYGTPPIPVTTSRTAISVQPEDGKTRITWQGRYDVADSGTAELVTRISRETVWPTTAQAIDSTLGR